MNRSMQGIIGKPYLSTCRPVNMSTCLPGLTGTAVNIGVHGIMGILYLLTCRPVNLSTRVDRSSGKYRSAWHYRFSELGHLSTWLSRLKGQKVNIGMQGMGISYYSALAV